MKHLDFVLVGEGPEPRPAAVRRSIEAFEERGFSHHSPRCLLGCYILKHCVANGIPFELRHHVIRGRAGGWTSGWTIERMEPA